MKKYYYKEGDKQVGPLALKDLNGKGITASTPIWYDPLPKWTTAGEVPELDVIINPGAAKANEKIYFYKMGGAQIGPVSLNELKTKSITADVPVWHDPLPKWSTAGEIAALKDILVAGTQPAVAAPAQTATAEPKKETAKAARTDEKIYFYKMGGAQIGPVSIDELKTKNITADVPVWHDPLPKWSTAGAITALKDIIVPGSQPVVAAPAAEPKKEAAKAAKTNENIYFYKTNGAQFGPVSIDELKTKNITSDTPIWYDPLPKWTTAGQVDALKNIIVAAPAVEVKKEEPSPVAPAPVVETKTETTSVAASTVVEMKEEPKPTNGVEKKEEPKTETPVVISTPVVEIKEEPKVAAAAAVVEAPAAVATTIVEPVKEQPAPQPKIAEPVVAASPVAAATVATSPAPAPAVAVAPAPAAKAARPPRKKGPAWVTYVLGALLLGGMGYYVYQDMDKYKNGNTANATLISNETTTSNPTDNNSNTQSSTTDPNTTTSTTSSTTVPVDNPVNSNTSNTATDATTNNNVVTTVPVTNANGKTTVTTTSTVKPVANQKLTKQQIAAQKKAEDDAKKKLAADQKNTALQETANANKLAASRDADVRNHWPSYITIGKLDYDAHTFSGIRAFDVPIYNGTNATIDQITLRIDYIRAGGDLHKSETVILRNIPAKTGLNAKAPASSKGKKVNVYIVGIQSHQLHFCYPVNNGNSADPYYCN